MSKYVVFWVLWWAAAGWNTALAFQPGLEVGWRILAVLCALACFGAGAENLEKYIKEAIKDRKE